MQRLLLTLWLAFWLTACAPTPELPTLAPTFPPPTATFPPPTATFPPPPTLTPPPSPLPDPFAGRGTRQSTITSTNPAFGAFNTAEERHLYTFQGAAGTFVRLGMQPTSGTLDPVLTLLSPTGQPLAFDDDAGGDRTALISGLQLPSDGVYGVQAWGSGLPGTYELTLATAPEPFPVTPVVDGTGALPGTLPTEQPVVLTPTVQAASSGQLFEYSPIRGNLDRAGGVNIFQFEPRQDSVYTIGLQPLSEDFTPNIELMPPSGVIVADTSELGRDGELLIPGFIAESGDIHTLLITGLDGTTGEYILSYGLESTRADVRQAEIFPDRFYNAVMRRRAVRHVWYVRLEKGDMISASATLRTRSALIQC